MSEKTFNVAVVGATGAVGEAMLSILAERQFPVGTLHLLASERSAGEKIKYGAREIVVQDLATFDPAGVHIALFSAGGSVSKEYAPKFAAAGAVVIDNSSAFRYDDDVPLVVAEVNPEQVENRPRGIIANPNCSTMQMLVALAPIHRAVGIERINVATYQSVSGAGRSAMEELGRQTAAMLNFQPHEPAKFPVQIAFNLIPHIDEFQPNGYTKEEMKMINETKKIFSDNSIQVTSTTVRIPTMGGHSEAVNVEFKEDFDLAEVRSLLENAPGVIVQDDPTNFVYPMPITSHKKDEVFVGRLRRDESQPNTLNMWIVADNLRKGAATNAVQIAEYLLENKLV